MNLQLKKLTILGLRWVLGLVVLCQSAYFAFSSAGAHQFAETGLPHWLRPALGGSEVVAAVLFLAPAASLAGGYALLFIFAIAAGVHFLHGQFNVGGMVVYAMAVVVCMTHRYNEVAESPHDR